MVSDQFGNNVNEEIWITKDSTVTVTTSGPHFSSTDVKHEYGIAYADGKVDDVLYDGEGEARLALMSIRQYCKQLGIPEDYHPILMKREIITTTGSWKHLSV